MTTTPTAMLRPTLVFTAALTTALAAGAPAAAAQQTQTDASFNWTGRIADGRWIRVRDLNGNITVGAASGSDVQVTATKRWRRGNPADVRIETVKLANGDVQICALWGDPSTCDEQGYHAHNDNRDGNRDNDVAVNFRVLLPKGVKVAVGTINGAVHVDGATSDVDATGVNGEVDVVTTGGHIDATTINGSVRARIGRLDDTGDMDFKTVNGSVTLEVPNDFGADVDLRTMSGSINTDFPMTFTGRVSPHHLSTHIGRAGGPRIRLSTINGSVELRKY